MKGHIDYKKTVSHIFVVIIIPLESNTLLPPYENQIKFHFYMITIEDMNDNVDKLHEDYAKLFGTVDNNHSL